MARSCLGTDQKHSLFAITDISPSASGSVSGAVNYVCTVDSVIRNQRHGYRITLSHPWQKGERNPLICPPLSDSLISQRDQTHVNFEVDGTPSPLEVSIAYPAGCDGYFAVDRVAAIYSRKKWKLRAIAGAHST